MIDLRSDTVTKPNPAMRAAMASAEVGDDVYGEDPTINKLEQRAAEIFEREGSIFVPTGTMGNQIAIKLHTRPGQEIICEERGHIFNYEMAMLAWFSGCVIRPVRADDGILTWKLIEPKLSAKIYYLAQTGLISLENTHNMAGGAVMPPEVFNDVCDRAHEANLPVHLDSKLSACIVICCGSALPATSSDSTRSLCRASAFANRSCGWPRRSAATARRTHCASSVACAGTLPPN
jgi:threonine aldolase